MIQYFDPEVDTDYSIPKYHAAIGGLLWLAQCTCPDIAFCEPFSTTPVATIYGSLGCCMPPYLIFAWYFPLWCSS